MAASLATNALLQELALAEADIAHERERLKGDEERLTSEQDEAARRAAAMLTAQQSVAAAVGDAAASKAADARALATSTSLPSLTRDGHLQTTVEATPTKTKKAERTTRLPRMPSSRLTNSASAQSLHHQRRSAPSFGFGTASRQQAQKLSASPTVLLGTESPGPKYALAPSVGGKQPDKSSPPVWGFNKASRFGYGNSERRPGPDSYRLPSLLSTRQPDASKADAPRYSLQGRARAPVDAGLSSPGPAAYKLRPTVGGKQPHGKMRDAPTWTLTSRETMHVGSEPEPGVGSPGPIYKLPRGLGKQPDSAYRTEPMMSIASAERTPIEPGSNSPGPIYSLPSAIDKQIDGHKHSAPRPSFSKHSRWAGLEAEQKKNTVPGPGHYG